MAVAFQRYMVYMVLYKQLNSYWDISVCIRVEEKKNPLSPQKNHPKKHDCLKTTWLSED